MDPDFFKGGLKKLTLQKQYDITMFDYKSTKKHQKIKKPMSLKSR